MRWCKLINPHLDAALAWFDAGCAVIPATADGIKKPAVNWKAYYKYTPPTREKTIEWFTEHPEWGVGLLPGKFSNGLEMTEIEACRIGSEYLDKVRTEMYSRQVGALWDDLLEIGYCESTPSGGMHILYRVEGVDIPGNHKLATDSTGTITYAETRGTGGFVIVAPTSGTVHPTGESWSVISGQIGVIPVIGWDERCAIHEALTAALNERIREVREFSAPAPRVTPTGEPASLRPGDDFNARGDSWHDLLTRNGWSFHSMSGGQEWFTRPGKDPRDGHSAATNHNGQPGLYVWSGMPQERAYDKFGALVELEFNGDFKAAVKYLAAQGYGDQKEFKPVADISDWATVTSSVNDTVAGEPITFEPRDTPEQRTSRPYVKEYNHLGVAAFAQETIGDKFRRVSKENAWRFYEDGRWSEDNEDKLSFHLDKVTNHIKLSKDKDLADAKIGGDKEEIASAKALAAFANSLRMNRGIKDLMETFGRQKGISVAPEAFDARQDLLVLDNGTFDLSSMLLREHDPKDMITKRISVSYDRDATCPRWDKYLTEALPDLEQRKYIQRAVGMTILAKMDDAAFFVLHGLTGCGKSQFVNVMRAVLGEYAAEAAPSTFQASRFGNAGNGPTDDIHSLRGVRFASVSETEEGEVLKEALLKRVTGGDELTSRTLHQRNTTWKPQFTVWMMTNHKPKLSSTDGAIWRRVKPIHFPMNFSESTSRELGLSKKIVSTELSGVFNWVLEGVREYLRIGLAEPAETTAAIADYRAEVDPVQTFLTEGVDEGRITLDPESKIKPGDLRKAYLDWCVNNGVRHPVGERKFSQRLEELGFESTRGNGGVRLRVGIRVNDAFGSGNWLR